MEPTASQLMAEIKGVRDLSERSDMVESDNSILIARLEERMGTIERDLRTQADQFETMDRKLDEVLRTLSEARGGWRTLMWIGGAMAAFGGFISWSFNHITFR